MRYGSGAKGWTMGSILAVVVLLACIRTCVFGSLENYQEAQFNAVAAELALPIQDSPAEVKLDQIKHIDHKRAAPEPFVDPALAAGMAGGMVMLVGCFGGLLLLGRKESSQSPAGITDEDVERIMAEELAKEQG